MLISPEYKALNEKLHEDNANFGAKGFKRSVQIWDTFIKPYGLHAVLDYGCGKGTLGKALEKLFSVYITGYDPCVPKYSKEPKKGIFDGVICMDVLEHIEPDLLGNVLKDIRSYGSDEGLYYFNIALVNSNKFLPDGRNAHLIVKTKEWWSETLIAQGYKIKSGTVEKYKNEDGTVNEALGFFNCICKKETQ